MAQSIVNQYTEEELREIVEKSYSYKELLQNLGYTTFGGNNNKTVQKMLEKYNISIEHFTTKKGIERTEDNIFCKNSTASQATLRRWFIKKQYIEYKCDLCGNSGEWNGQPLVLQLDHIDGDNHNNTIDNLRWLCPNCHSQTDTFCGKQKEKNKLTKNGIADSKTIKYCKNCGEVISNQADLCKKCYHLNRRIVKRPSREELKQKIRNQSFTQIGKEYGVSDNTVRKWCDAYSLPRKVSKIKKYSEKEWELI